MIPILLGLVLVVVVLAITMSKRAKPAALPRGGGPSTFAEAIAQLAVEPSAESYLTVFGLVVTHPTYQPYSNDLQDLIGLFEAEKYGEVQRKLAGMMPNWVLTPAVHKIACLTAKRRGDERAAMVEARLAMACIQGLMATGDGTKDKPYVVVRVRDEYELLEHLEKRPTKQMLLRDGERQLDCFELDDGSKLYFDISVPKGHLDRQLGGDAPS
jgi:hypothetical protein